MCEFSFCIEFSKNDLCILLLLFLFKILPKDPRKKVTLFVLIVKVCFISKNNFFFQTKSFLYPFFLNNVNLACFTETSGTYFVKIYFLREHNFILKYFKNTNYLSLFFLKLLNLDFSNCSRFLTAKIKSWPFFQCHWDNLSSPILLKIIGLTVLKIR